MIRHHVPDALPEMSAYRYVRRAWPLLPDQRVREVFRKKDVRINSRRIGREDTLRGGDELQIYLPDTLFDLRIKVLFDDGHLLAVEKPVGLPVDADREGIGADTVLIRVRENHESAELCHRLDTDTGGAMLLSLDEETGKALHKAFKESRVSKIYRAIVVGMPEKKGSITSALQKDAASGRVKIAHIGGEYARTDYVVLKDFSRSDEKLSYVEIDLKTGKTHQIRAHFASIGCPLLGDDKYGDRAVNRRLKAARPKLWCRELSIDMSMYREKRFLSPDPFGEEI